MIHRVVRKNKKNWPAFITRTVKYTMPIQTPATTDTQRVIRHFAAPFCRALSIPINARRVAVGYSQLPCTGLYVCKETWDTRAHPRVRLFIDCVDRRGTRIERTARRYYHVTWAALTYYIREIPHTKLLCPLRELCAPDSKTKFCDYMFFNRTYRNGVRR